MFYSIYHSPAEFYIQRNKTYYSAIYGRHAELWNYCRDRPTNPVFYFISKRYPSSKVPTMRLIVQYAGGMVGWMFTREQIGHLKKVTTIACVYLYRALPPVLSSFHEYIDFIHTKFCYIITYTLPKKSQYICAFFLDIKHIWKKLNCDSFG